MYEEQLISKLISVGYTLDNIKSAPTGPGIRAFEPTPPRSERHEAGVYRGTVKY